MTYETEPMQNGTMMHLCSYKKYLCVGAKSITILRQYTITCKKNITCKLATTTKLHWDTVVIGHKRFLLGFKYLLSFDHDINT